MIPSQHGRRRRQLGFASFPQALQETLRRRSGQVVFGVLVLLLLVTWKAVIQLSRCASSTASLEERILGVGQLVDLQEHTIEQFAADLEQVRNSSKTSPKVLPGLCRSMPSPEVIRQLQLRHRHKMAVVVPYRDRQEMLDAFLPSLHSFLRAQGRDYSIFILEQSPKLRFNRGLLLNAGVLLLAGSDYDYFVFHDVDTLPTEVGGIPYDYPTGTSPLHLTPPGIHPKVGYEDFFGGVTAFTWEQLQRVNGYGNEFWGWGREDDNMRERLKRAGMWPPERPAVPRRSARYYFRHTPHQKAPEVRVRASGGGGKEYVESNPDVPYGDSLIVSSQPGTLDDYTSGLQSSQFWVKEIVPVQNFAVKYVLELVCNRTVTPWCDSS